MSVFVRFSVGIAVAIIHLSSIKGIDGSDFKNVLGGLSPKLNSLEHTSLVEQSQKRGQNTNDVQNIARSPQVQIAFPYKENVFIDSEKDRRNKHVRYQHWPWRHYLYVKPAWLKSAYTPRKQNYILRDLNYDVGNNDLRDYSKVYLVLDPKTDITESDVRDLSNIVSSMLLRDRTPRNTLLKDQIQTNQIYKGLLVNDHNRRRMRDSNERAKLVKIQVSSRSGLGSTWMRQPEPCITPNKVFAQKDSIERDYKPKRPRSDYGGGGGRTAIPYIGHRGDIFENE